jgi:putative transposase
MAMRSVALAPDEWYHCFSRGVDKRDIFLNLRDHERFLMLLYSCNNTEPLHISNLGTRHQGPALVTVLQCERGEQLVDIGAYCLMPNHIHLLLRERIDGGISSFMQKVGTGYTMYFNKRLDRTGALFSSRFKALHVASDQYFGRVVNYIHANPAELYEPRWKEGIVGDRPKLKRLLLEYTFSSLPEYEGTRDSLSAIINKDAVLELLTQAPSFETLMDDAEVYYSDREADLQIV